METVTIITGDKINVGLLQQAVKVSVEQVKKQVAEPRPTTIFEEKA